MRWKLTPTVALSIIGSSGIFSMYKVHRRNVNQREFLVRMGSLSGRKDLSGVIVRERRAMLPYLGPINWFMKHQSLLIPSGSDSVRLVGLGPLLPENVSEERRKKRKSSLRFRLKDIFATQWRDHLVPPYTSIDVHEKEFPLESWQEYKNIFGYYPECIDVSKLNQVTQTPKEMREKGIDPSSRPTPFFGSRVTDRAGRTHFFHCHSAAQLAVNASITEKREQEIIKNNGNNS